MKSVLLYALLALPIAAQSSNWHGMKAGPAQRADLADSIQPQDGHSARAVQFETWVERLPRNFVESVYPEINGIERKGEKTTIRRIIRDNFRMVQIGYSLSVETQPGSRAYRVVFDELPPMDGQNRSVPPGWTIVAPADRPVPQIVQAGEILKLTLFVSPNGPKVVEFVRIGPVDRQPLQEDPARDSYSIGAEFSITHPKLKANGQHLTFEPVTDFQSALLRVRIPGFGSYVLSLEPHADLNFEEAGEVSGNALVFTNRGNIFRIDCADRIASGSAKFNVYAHMEPVAADVREPAGPTIKAEPTDSLPSF